MNQCPFVDIDHVLAETRGDWPNPSVHDFPGGIFVDYELPIEADCCGVALPRSVCGDWNDH